MLIKDKLAKQLNKEFENSDTCDFFINVIMEYANDEEASQTQ